MKIKIVWIIAGLVIVILIIILALPKRKAPTSTTQVLNSQNASQVASNQAAQNNSNQTVGEDPGNVYLAYKQDLSLKTTAASDIFNLAKKYLPAIIIQGWEAEGGVSAVFPTSRQVCAYLNTSKNLYPEYPLVKVDSEERPNATSAILHTSAGAGQQGKVTMVLEQGGWKVEQESWPAWPVKFVPCPN